MRKYFVGAFFILLAAYVLFQARNIILGPRLTIDFPKAESSVPAGPLTISGTAKNVSFLSLNDRQIYTDTIGRWSEQLIASRGISIMKLTARDRFGRQVTKTVRIVAQ